MIEKFPPWGPKLFFFVPEQETTSFYFSGETERLLIRKGYKIFDLSKVDLGDITRLVSFPEAKDKKIFEPMLKNLKSNLHSVAVNVQRPFLPGSNSKSFHEQERLIREFSRQLGVYDVGVIRGRLEDHLAFNFLVGRPGCFPYGNNFVSTETSVGKGRKAIVGGQGSLSLGAYLEKEGNSDIWVAPFIIPLAKAKS